MKPALPSAFLQSIAAAPGFDKMLFEQVHANKAQVTSVRINPAKLQSVDQSMLPVKGPVPWSSYGYYLSERPAFIADPLFHAGCYYVQEASSMFLEQALKQTVALNEPLKVLDLCAAPGGKSTLIQSLLSKDSFLVSNEVIKQRATVLAENITKTGATNVVVTNNDPKDFEALDNYFDVIVIDAPCSGSGLFRREPEAIEEWSLDNVRLCSQRQQRIIADVLPALRDGGILIYSTCSYSMEEDEAIMQWMVDELPLSGCALQLDPAWGIVETFVDNRKAHGYRFYPYNVEGEGFFLSCFRKDGMSASGSSSSKKSSIEKPTKNELALLKEWMITNDASTVLKWKTNLLALASALAKELPLLQQYLYIRQAGIEIGECTPKELIPAHAFAMSNLVQPQVPLAEFTLQESQQYLRKADILPHHSWKRGWTLVQYLHHNLGWMKVLPNRINNYYPKEWRILKQL